MMDISNDPNSIATMLADSINAAYLDSLPHTNSDTMDVSQSNQGPLSKEKARALRARKNLTVTTKRPLRRIRRIPSFTSSSDSEGPDTANKLDEGPTRSDGHSDGHSHNSNEESLDDDARLPASKETPHLSAAGNPNASTKRHHSSSSIDRKKLGSMENPIDVDGIASLFEPMVIKEYVCQFFHSLNLC